MGENSTGVLLPNKKPSLAVVPVEKSLLNKPEEMSLLLSRSTSYSFKGYQRPRSSSILYAVNSKFPGGILTRINYMSRCFYAAWVNNQADTPRLKMVLWKKSSVRTNFWIELIALLLKWMLPFAPLLLFVSPEDIHTHTLRVTIWFFFLAEFVSFAWHVYLLFVTLRNLLIWKSAWFTFQVREGTIGVVDTFSSGLTEFNRSANVRFMTVFKGHLRRLQAVSRHEQEQLDINMKTRHMEQAEVILYSENFIRSFSTWPRNMCLALIVATALSEALVSYFLVKAY